MGASTSVARNAERLDAMNFPESNRYYQFTDPNNPTGGYIVDSDTEKLHQFVSFMFVRNTSSKPEFVEIVCSSMYNTESGKLETGSEGVKIFHVTMPIQYACSFSAMPTHDSVAWSGSYSPSADAKLSRDQLGFTCKVDEDNVLSDIRFGW